MDFAVGDRVQRVLDPQAKGTGSLITWTVREVKSIRHAGVKVLKIKWDNGFTSIGVEDRMLCKVEK